MDYVFSKILRLTRVIYYEEITKYLSASISTCACACLYIHIKNKDYKYQTGFNVWKLLNSSKIDYVRKCQIFHQEIFTYRIYRYHRLPLSCMRLTQIKKNTDFSLLRKTNIITFSKHFQCLEKQISLHLSPSTGHRWNEMLVIFAITVNKFFVLKYSKVIWLLKQAQLTNN